MILIEIIGTRKIDGRKTIRQMRNMSSAFLFMSSPTPLTYLHPRAYLPEFDARILQDSGHDDPGLVENSVAITGVPESSHLGGPDSLMRRKDSDTQHLFEFKWERIPQETSDWDTSS
jgi:hypothetical protein